MACATLIGVVVMHNFSGQNGGNAMALKQKRQMEESFAEFEGDAKPYNVKEIVR